LPVSTSSAPVPQTNEVRRWTANHVWTGPLWVAVYLTLVTGPTIAVFLEPKPRGVEFGWNLSMALGLAGLSMMSIQFALTARIRAATAPFGADLVYVFHRYLALVGFALVGLHFLILWLFYGDALGSLDPRVAAWELTVARIALVAFGLAVVTAEFRKTLRLEYGLWRYLHVGLAITGLVAAIAHVVGTGRLAGMSPGMALWAAITAFWMGLVIWLRLAKPWRLKRRPYEVVEVRQERGGAWTLALMPRGRPVVRDFSPGQFVWLNMSSSPWAPQDHPFSISSSPTQLPRIEMTIKPLGDFTATIGDVPVGQTAWLDGPFGVFSIDRYPDAPGFVFVAGGIGITPVMSMLRALDDQDDPRPLWLFYGNADWDSVTFREELGELETRLNLTIVHIIEEPSPDYAGLTGRLDDSILRQHLPEDRPSDFRYFLCGPVPLTETAEAGLVAMGVTPSHIRTELFELA
jgi:predicted ferric reductase